MNMTPQQREQFNRLLSEYLSEKLSKSMYKYEPRDIQLAYLLGLTFKLLEDTVELDNHILNKLIHRVK